MLQNTKNENGKITEEREKCGQNEKYERNIK